MHDNDRSPSSATARGPARALRILLAEDNRQLRTLLAMAMYSDGHSVDECADGYALVEQIATLMLEEREDDVDLVIAEQELPAIPGLAVLAGLRARGQATPFVLMTANEAVQARARELGAAILDRPFDLGAIRAAIRQALALPANQRFEATPVPAVTVARRYGSA